VICADGKHDNPDFETLEWLVRAARAQQRQPHILVTSETDNTRRLLHDFPPAEWGYTLAFLPAGEDAIVIDLLPPAARSEDLTAIKGIGPIFAARLEAVGIRRRAQLLLLSAEELAAILRTGVTRAGNILSAAG
jgi:hypothetical protein